MEKFKPITALSTSKTNSNMLLNLTIGSLFIQLKTIMMIRKLIMHMLCLNNLQVLLELSLKNLDLLLFKVEVLKIGKNKSEMMLKKMVLLKLLYCSSRDKKKNTMVKWKDSWQKKWKYQVKLSEGSHLLIKYPQETCHQLLKSFYKWMLRLVYLFGKFPNLFKPLEKRTSCMEVFQSVKGLMDLLWHLLVPLIRTVLKFILRQLWV